MMLRNNNYTNFNRDNKQTTNRMFQRKGRYDERIIQDKSSPSIDLKSQIAFPSLRGTLPENLEENVSCCYINSVLKAPIEETEFTAILNELEIGWVSFSMSILGGSIDIKHNVKEELVCEKDVNNSGVKVIEKLNEMYENWQGDYIDTWGEEEYIKDYTFPNHNMNHFDEMDEMDDLQEINDLEEIEKRNGYASEGSY